MRIQFALFPESPSPSSLSVDILDATKRPKRDTVKAIAFSRPPHVKWSYYFAFCIPWFTMIYCSGQTPTCSDFVVYELHSMMEIFGWAIQAALRYRPALNCGTYMLTDGIAVVAPFHS